MESSRDALCRFPITPVPKAIYVGLTQSADIACKRLVVTYPAFSEGGRAFRDNPLAVSTAVRLASYYLALFETLTGHTYLLNVKRLEGCSPRKDCFSVVSVVFDPWEMECGKRINLALRPLADALLMYA